MSQSEAEDEFTNSFTPHQFHQWLSTVTFQRRSRLCGSIWDV